MLENLYRSVLLIAKQYKKNYDVLFVPFPAFFDIFLAFIIAKIKRKTLVSDFFVSKNITYIDDFQLASKKSFKAFYLKSIDRLAAFFGGKLIADTKAHALLFEKKLKISKNRFFCSPVGSMADDIKKSEVKNDNGKFNVFFYGSYLPLHGIQYIIGAAKRLNKNNDIYFTLIGNGYLLPKMVHYAKKLKVKNIKFVDRFVSFRELVLEMQKADLCLGIFGASDKAKAVIPNKVYDALALAKPLITLKSFVYNEVGLIHGKHLWFCEAASAKSLAEAILKLKSDEKLRTEIAQNGFQRHKNNFTAEILGRDLKSFLKRAMRS